MPSRKYIEKPSYYKDVIRMLKSHGMKAHAREFDQAITALKVIHTWASYLGGRVMDADNVAKLCEKALKPYKEKHDN